MKKSVILSLFIALAIMLGLANVNTISAQQTVEDQYWEAVKNSTKADDFKGYLKEYPNGKYAAIARQKINPPTSAKETDVEFLNSWAAEVRDGLPEMIGDFQLTDSWSRCPAGCKEEESSTYLLLLFNASDVQKSVPIEQLQKTLTPRLLEEYCKSEAIPRKVALGVYFRNRDPDQYANYYIQPTECAAKTNQGKTVFITSQQYDGNLGGVSGANATCQMHAKNAGLSGTFYAWLADNNSSPLTSFTKSTVPYLMTNGIQIAANWHSLIASDLDAKLDVDEYGKSHVNGSTWTGTDEKKSNCQSWTSNASDITGAEGCSSTKDSRWGKTNCGTNWCNYKYRLYCFQQ